MEKIPKCHLIELVLMLALIPVDIIVCNRETQSPNFRDANDLKILAIIANFGLFASLSAYRMRSIRSIEDTLTRVRPKKMNKKFKLYANMFSC